MTLENGCMGSPVYGPKGSALGGHFCSDMEEPSDVDHAVQGRRPASRRQRSRHLQEEEEEKLRRKIKFYFMNPCEKYHARGRKPWKLMLQIIKIAIITAQVMMMMKK